MKAEEYPRHSFSFVTGLFSGHNSVLKKIAPQVVPSAVPCRAFRCCTPHQPNTHVRTLVY